MTASVQHLTYFCCSISASGRTAASLLAHLPPAQGSDTNQHRAAPASRDQPAPTRAHRHQLLSPVRLHSSALSTELPKHSPSPIHEEGCLTSVPHPPQDRKEAMITHSKLTINPEAKLLPSDRQLDISIFIFFHLSSAVARNTCESPWPYVINISFKF